MHLLAEQKLLPEFKGMHLEKCVDCLAGKQNRAAFHTRTLRRIEAALELVHMDVSYVDAPLHQGGQYFVTFIDDYSWKTWAFILKSKDQASTIVFQGVPGKGQKRVGSEVEDCLNRQWW